MINPKSIKKAKGKRTLKSANRIRSGTFANSKKRDRYGDNWKTRLSTKSGVCVKCGRQGYTEYHHIVPLSKGGANNALNIIELCHNCHAGQVGHSHMKKW